MSQLEFINVESDRKNSGMWYVTARGKLADVKETLNGVVGIGIGSVVWILFHGSFSINSSLSQRAQQKSFFLSSIFAQNNSKWMMEMKKEANRVALTGSGELNSVNMNFKLDAAITIAQQKLRLFAVIWGDRMSRGPTKKSKAKRMLRQDVNWKDVKMPHERITLAHPIKLSTSREEGRR